MSAFTLWRDLRANPIYRRERGDWGRPNPFYDRLAAYSPLLVVAVVAVGLCSTTVNPLFLGDNSTLMALYCLICFPSVLLSVVTLYGALMAPALTAPSVSVERQQGTWETLRATPYSSRTILLAKVTGALARLRIWPIVLVLALLQAATVFCGFILGLSGTVWWGFLAAAATFVRPWLEIFCAGILGTTCSVYLPTGATALATAYGMLLFVRVLNSTTLWMAGLSLAGVGEATVSAAGIIGSTALYALVTIVGVTLAARGAER